MIVKLLYHEVSSGMEMYAHAEILIADDNLADIVLIKTILEEIEFAGTLKVVSTGREALQYLQDRLETYPMRSQQPSLVLIDLNMPVMGGLELLKALKKDPKMTVIPTVILSTSDRNDDIEKCYALGAGGYIVKPLNYELFKEKIASTLAFWHQSGVK